LKAIKATCVTIVNTIIQVGGRNASNRGPAHGH
jgi:hypothetical protein